MRVPIATYRLQFNAAFGFAQALEILSYLADLGISDIYASPIFKARKGSLHGYDVVDQTQINPELGMKVDFKNLMEAVKERGLGWVQDIVPNHMAYSQENALLWDVLENGENSRYFNFFDIFWDHPCGDLRGRLLAPFLGKMYSEALEGGEIKLEMAPEGLGARYYDLKLPLKPESMQKILSGDTTKVGSGRGAGQDGDDLKRGLWEKYSRDEEFQELFDSALGEINGIPGKPESFDALDKILSDQRFKLSFWRVASQEINYRRFFTINEIIALRSDLEEVFDHTHALILDLAARGDVTGLRIDHIDGLKDPAAYLRKLRERAGDRYIIVEKILSREERLPSWPVQGTTGYDFLNLLGGVLVNRESGGDFERIYSGFTGLTMPYGETVYKKKKAVLEKEMEGDAENLSFLLKRVSAGDRHGRDITHIGLKSALAEIMALFPVYRTYGSPEGLRPEDRSTLTDVIKRAKDRNPELKKELEFIEHYLLLEPGGMEEEKRDSIEEVVVGDNQKNGVDSDEISERKKRAEDHDTDRREGPGKDKMQFLFRLQQFTIPLMAKGFEDTLLYNYNRIISLNEVGGSPDRFGATLDEFHGFLAERAVIWPASMNATATHDTKRGEDARARINVLSEIPEKWQKALEAWGGMNKGKKKEVKGRLLPGKDDEYFLYQTLLGSLPFYADEYPSFEERAGDYLIKAAREAKVHSGWDKPDTSYEESMTAFFNDILRRAEDNPFPRDLWNLLRTVGHHGILNSLAQTLIKITAPGVPDFYQGTELWDLSFVDPDNRRPVDFKIRKAYLEDIMEREEKDMSSLISELLYLARDGRVKMFLIHRALKARWALSELFLQGDYLPLYAQGSKKKNIVAFARRFKEDNGTWALTVAPRITTDLVDAGEYPLGTDVWRDTFLALPKGAPEQWMNALTGEKMVIESNDDASQGEDGKKAQEGVEADRRLPLGNALSKFPVALLLAGDGI